MIDEATINKAVELLRSSTHLTRIILFGSYARGDKRTDSDLDLLVVIKDVHDRFKEMVRLNRILSPLRIPVDLLVTSEETFRHWCNTPGNVYSAALTEGKVLYEQPA